MNEDMIKRVVSTVVRQCLAEQNKKAVCCFGFEVPVEASGKHVHLTQEDVERLFGAGHQLTPKRMISQPGQFLSEERVTILGPQGCFHNVAVLGPVRAHTQVEVSLTDAQALGVDAQVAMSGDLSHAADIMILSGNACILAEKSLIVAKNHLHMDPESAEKAGLKDGDVVDIEVGTDRPLIFRHVPVRAGEKHKLAMHIDYDEANACDYSKTGKGRIVRICDGSCQMACGSAASRTGSAAAGQAAAVTGETSRPAAGTFAEPETAPAGTGSAAPEREPAAAVTGRIGGNQGKAVELARSKENIPTGLRFKGNQAGAVKQREAYLEGSAEPDPGDMVLTEKFISEGQVKAAADSGARCIVLKPGAILSPLAKDCAARYHVRIRYTS